MKGVGVMSWKTIKVSAIDPKDFQIKTACLIFDYFGTGKHAIDFGGINTPNYLADEIPYVEDTQ